MIFLKLALVGLAAGTLSGLFGVGGGVVIVPGLIFVLGIPLKEAAAISLAVIVPTALVGVLKSHYQGSGQFNPSIVVMILSGSLLGAYLGASLAHLMPTVTMKRAFAIFLIVVALDMLFGWTERIKLDSF